MKKKTTKREGRNLWIGGTEKIAPSPNRGKENYFLLLHSKREKKHIGREKGK